MSDQPVADDDSLEEIATSSSSVSSWNARSDSVRSGDENVARKTEQRAKRTGKHDFDSPCQGRRTLAWPNVVEKKGKKGTGCVLEATGARSLDKDHRRLDCLPTLITRLTS
ncbi:uncharacterized protein LOC143354002 [Halictus rubicundus]|uniref:uncharacterized protein LOC143354002 n=1 Tax=Halictus rubicundus TaxID=77578 RepID=UPI00403686BC